MSASPEPQSAPASALGSALDAQLAGRRIVPANEAALLREAQRLLDAAQQEYERLVAAGQREAETRMAGAEQRVAEAVERGYREGLERGLADRAREFALKGSRQARRLTTLDERIGMLVMRTLGTILTDRENDERFFDGVMQRVLRAARDEKFLTVRVHPEQRDAARVAIERLVKSTGAAPFIEVTTDADLKRGACIVESEHGVIDASLDTQLEAIGAALSAAWREPPAGEGAASSPSATTD